MEIQIGNRLAEVTLLSKSGNKVSIQVDGKVYNVDISMLSDGQCSIINDGISYDPYLVHQDGSRHYTVNLNYSTYEIDMLDSRARYMKMRRKADSSQEPDMIKAPMPSRVVKVFVTSGQEIREGDQILTIEAMKMQSTIVAPKDCVVAAVLCQDGDNVKAEQLLATLTFKE